MKKLHRRIEVSANIVLEVSYEEGLEIVSSDIFYQIIARFIHVSNVQARTMDISDIREGIEFNARIGDYPDEIDQAVVNDMDEYTAEV